MTKTLTVANELLDRALTLNKAVENYYLELAWVLSQVSETETYKEAGYETYAEYVQGDLNRSKTFASNLLLVGDFLRKNNYAPQELDTSYSRLAIAIRGNKGEDPARIVASAVSLNENELLTSKAEKEFPNCSHPRHICKDCKQPV